MVMKKSQARGVSAIDGTSKARIERAALSLFATHGIDGVSTKQIAQKSGLSEGAIYRHFPSKEALARDMMRAIHNRLTDMIGVAAERDHGLRDQVDFITRHYCQVADDDWDLFRYHILHLHHFKSLEADEVEENTPRPSPLEATARLLEHAMTRGEIKPGHPVILAAMSLGIVLQTAQAKVFGALNGPLSDHVDIFRGAVLRVLEINETN